MECSKDCSIVKGQEEIIRTLKEELKNRDRMIEGYIDEKEMEG